MGTRLDVSAFLENWRNQNRLEKRSLVPPPSLAPYMGSIPPAMPPVQGPLSTSANYIEMAAKQMAISSFSQQFYSMGTFSLFSVRFF